MNKKIKSMCSSCNEKESYCRGLCKTCYYRGYLKGYYERNKDKMKEGQKKRYYDNREKCLKGMKIYAEKNKEKLKEYRKNYYQKNHDKMRNSGKLYYEQNKKELNRKQHEKKKARRLVDDNFRLEENLKCRIAGAIMSQKGKKSKRTLELLGAPISIVKKHLESQFTEGMSWDTHGIDGWHIDHIIPCDFFDLTKEEEQQKCFHYTNLQPLWSLDNIRKGNKLQI